MTATKATKVLLFILLFAFALGVFMVDILNTDFWWHLATGRWIVEHGRLPDGDPFSFTTLQKDPYAPIDRVSLILNQYWLAQISMYKIYALWGFAGISIFRALVLTFTIAVIGLILRRHNVHSILIVGLLFMAIFVFMGYTGERPEFFSFLFAALLLYLLERYRSSACRVRTPESGVSGPESGVRKSDRSTLFAIPFLMALWSNLHGGYIYGVVIILIYISSEWLRLLVERLRGKRDFALRSLVLFTVIGIVAILATCANPNTYHGIIDHFRYQPGLSYGYISEWVPTYKLYEYMTIYFGMLILLAIMITVDILRKKRADITHVLLFIFNGALSLSGVRFVPFFIISGSFLLGIYLDPLLPKKAFEKRKWLEGVSLAMIFLVIIGAAFVTKKVSIKRLYRTGVSYGYRTGAIYEEYPRGAVSFLRQLPPKRIFNHYSWGGYLIWTLYPEYQVFIDSRALNQEILVQYAEVIDADTSVRIFGEPKWKGILDSYQIDYILLSPRETRLIFALVNHQDWRLIYADRASLLFIRSKEEFRDIITIYNLPPEVAYETMLVHRFAESLLAVSKEEKIRTYWVISEIYIKMNREEDARVYIRKALELDPQNPALNALARAVGA